MRVLFDTNVILCAHLHSHPFFQRADLVYNRHTTNPLDECYLSQHSIAELYCNLTRLPLGTPLEPSDALTLLEQSILRKLKPMDLTSQDYLSIIQESATLGVKSAAIYDALIARCAEKAQVDVLYTFNPKDFLRVWPAGAAKIVEP